MFPMLLTLFYLVQNFKASFEINMVVNWEYREHFRHFNFYSNENHVEIWQNI